MAVEAIGWEGANTDYAPSNSIWGRCPINAIKEGKVNGYIFEDYFTSLQGGAIATTEGTLGAGVNYAQFSSASATIVPSATISNATTAASNGLTFAAVNNNDGVSLRTLVVPFSINRSSQKFWFEASVQRSTIANTTFNFFLGLMENVSLTSGVPMSAADTLSNNNLCGFLSKSAVGTAVDTVYKAAGVSAVTVGAADGTMAAATYTKLGMKFEPKGDNKGSYWLSFYQDGTRLPNGKQIPTAAGTDFPNNVSLGLVFSVRNAAGSSPGTATMRWWRAAQLQLPLN